jgi:hypothetical protein
VLFIGSIFTPWAVVWGALPGHDRADRLVLAEAARRPSRHWPWSVPMTRATNAPAQAREALDVRGCRATPSAIAA